MLTYDNGMGHNTDKPDKPSDAEIINRVIEGDVNAFEGLLKRYQHYVLAIVKKLVEFAADVLRGLPHVGQQFVTDAIVERIVHPFVSCRFPGRGPERSITSIAGVWSDLVPITA